MKKRYRLERCLEGVWHHWGTYSDINALVKAATELGGYGYREQDVRVTEVD